MPIHTHEAAPAVKDKRLYITMNFTIIFFYVGSVICALKSKGCRAPLALVLEGTHHRGMRRQKMFGIPYDGPPACQVE